MNAIVEILNTAGRAFVDFAVPMLIQSSLLILILLAVDAVLRKRVRAVFRYWIWMLVLVKLVLPPSLWSPVSVGTWLGDKLEVSTAALLEAPEPSPVPLPQAELSPVVTNIVSQPPRIFTEPPRLEPTLVPPAPTETEHRAAPIDIPPALSLHWQGFTLLVWGIVVGALLLLLAQRTYFVQGLVAQADEASGAMLRELDECHRRLGLRRQVSLRFSPNAASPAVCGLLRPVILIPQSLASRLRGADLQAVLYHELAHVQRGDLWVNVIQTLLQIAYFYNPLLWLANTAIRRIREKAVDETVLVAMGEAAPQYPETLVHVAKLAFTCRPALSLRLIGVVESKNALTGRIKHILNRPLPKTAKLGALGLATVALVAALLLPMARGKDVLASVRTGREQIMVVRWMAVLQDNKAERILSDAQPVTSKSQSYHAVRLGSEELLARVRDCRKSSQVLYLVEDLKWVQPSPKYLRADSWSYSTNLNHPVYVGCTTGGAGPYKLDVRPTEVRLDLQSESVNCNLNPGVRAEGSIFFKGSLPPGQALVFAAPLQKDGQPVATHLVVWQAVRVPGDSVTRVPSIRSTIEWIEEGPRVLIAQARMPLPELAAHEYYRRGEPIRVYVHGKISAWKADTGDILRKGGMPPAFLRIDGKEYECLLVFGPFESTGRELDIPEQLQMNPANFHLPWGRHTAVYGWRDVNVIDPNDPSHPVHCAQLVTNPVQFEIVQQLPADYYRPVYQEGWEDILRRSLQTPFTDAPEKHGVAGPLLTLRVRTLPFDIAFEIHAQAEGSAQRQPVGQAAIRAGSPPDITTCSPAIDGLNWSTAGDKRWRLILVPSEKVAAENPPIHEFYGREFVTDWVSFERSPQFEQHRHEFEHRGNNSPADTQPASVPGAKDFVCTLPNGITVELLGVCEHPSADRPWWRPDGRPLAIRPYDRLMHTEKSPAWKHYEVLFRIQRAAGEVFTKLKPGYPQVLGSSGPGSVQDPSWAQTSPPQGAENLFSAILFVEPEVRQVQLELGIGIESAWETRGALEGQIDSGSVAVPGAMFGPAIGKDGRTFLTVAHRILDREIRLLALDKKGQAHKPTGLSARESSDLGHCQAEFDLPIANIASIQLQTQQLTWVTFQNVPLDPNLSTRVAAPADRGAGGGAPVKSGTVNPSAGPNTAASWQNIGPAIPPDANDARTLAPGVILEGSGADVEEKAFISCVRDLAQTTGRQYRFVLVPKEGQTLEPSYYTSLPREGGKVWEKFTFDASHLPWKLSHFQLQSRPVPADGRPVAPSPREEVLAQAARPSSGVSETQPGAAGLQASGGPPGRYALSFDGAGDYLYIPDSDSLRQAAALTVEMWIKPQLPEGPHINRPRWGLLGHGAYLGTGRANVSGFGIKIDGLDPATRNLMIDYGEALGDGISCTILGELFSNNWVHILHTFGHGSYRPAPGHPMIVGRYLIPSEDPYPGQIGEIRLWDSDKAQESDIRRYENVVLTGKEPGLVACWTFEEGQGQIAYDISPNANHARLGSSIEPDAADPKWVDLSAVSLAATEKETGRSDAVPGSTGPAQDTLKRLLAEARPGAIVAVPKGRYTTPIEITKPVVLRGEAVDDCVFEVTADQPAILVNTKGQGQATIENLTIRWQLASGGTVELPAAVLVKSTTAVIRNCRFAPLGDVKRSPMAVYLDGTSESTVDNCRFTGFDYVVCYGQGTAGVVQDCVIADCGHQGVIGYDGSTLIVQRNIITGSKFHAVRCTGGTLDVKDNLLIRNANRGIYLGNKTGRGTITNNLIMGNGSGISAFGRADYAIANNVIVNNTYAGIDMRDSCRLAIRNNVLTQNQRGLALFKEGTENSNVVAPNVFWANATDAENLEKPAGSIAADPQFADPNRGDFALRAPAREQGYGLTNPQVLKVLWEKYEQLPRDLSAKPPTRVNPVPPSSRTQTSNQPPAVLAWQRTDRYVPPDPNGFFPDDPEAGKTLDVLFRAGDRDGRSDAEILSTTRRGFRRTTHSHNSVLQWIGNHFIWGKQPQNPEAIEIMYHAVPLEQHYAVYSGLSVVKNKSPNILRTLAAICMQGEEVGRIAWGIGAQREQLLSYITPYLHDQDPAKQEMAAALLKHFQGELDFESWLAGYRIRQGQLKFGPQLAQFKEALRTGDSETRYQTLTTIGHNRKWVEILDDSFLPVLQTVSADPDHRVRNEVASLAGYRWLWVTPAQPQDPSVIELMLQLSADSDRQVRYNAVYYGLSAVRDKSEPVIRRLIQLAITDPDTDLFGRIAWSLRNSLNTGRQLFERTWTGELEAANTDEQRATIRRLYKDVLGQEPPAT